jgi:hypothetical protein
MGQIDGRRIVGYAGSSDPFLLCTPSSKVAETERCRVPRAPRHFRFWLHNIMLIAHVDQQILAKKLCTSADDPRADVWPPQPSMFEGSTR